MSAFTADIDNASTVDEMADAFNPRNISGDTVHRSDVLDLIEAALLLGARRINADQFREVLADSPLLSDALDMAIPA